MELYEARHKCAKQPPSVEQMNGGNLMCINMIHMDEYDSSVPGPKGVSLQ